MQEGRVWEDPSGDLDFKFVSSEKEAESACDNGENGGKRRIVSRST